MSSVLSVRIDDADLKRLDSLGEDRRKSLTFAIRLLFAVKSMDVNEETESIQQQTTMEGVNCVEK
jgi:predicted transcriptional regulator